MQVCCFNLVNNTVICFSDVFFIFYFLLILGDGIWDILTICINSRTSNFHLFKNRDSLWILLNVVPPSLYSKEAIFQSDSRLNSAQGGKKERKNTRSFTFSH